MQAASPWAFFEAIDQSRRWHGKMLDALGLGCVESPYRVAFTEPGVTLRAYAQDSNTGPVLLIVTAPIKQPYIWDLAPEASVVRRLVRGGVRVYLVCWEPPGEEGAGFGLEDYAERLILDCADAAARATGGDQMLLAGHSLGGTLAAIFAALHPQRVRGLVVLASPLRFGTEAGRVVRLVGALAGASDAATDAIPGSFLSLVSYLASPETFGWARWLDWLFSVADSAALRNHLRVTRWTLDEVALPSRAFQDVARELCREDRFMRGLLQIRGRRAAPGQVNAPLLAVADARCEIVPPAAIRPFIETVSSKHKRLLWYEGDTGVALQHVGMLVGETAHAHLWPEISRWMRAAWAGQTESLA
jgi:polyhydroxyalkanoate synthase subunit PhaC